MIRFTSGYKYQLTEDYSAVTAVRPERDITTDFIDLDTDGLLTIRRGYAWDGPSGPTKSIADGLAKIPFVGAKLLKMFLKAFMRGSLGHDALYQLSRMGLLGRNQREGIDIQLREDCLEDGMSKFRARYVYRGVRIAGEAAASPSNVKKVHSAP